MGIGIDRQVRVLQLREIGRRGHDARSLDDAGPLAQRGADLHQRDRVLVEIGEDPKPDISRHPGAHRANTREAMPRCPRAGRQPDRRPTWHRRPAHRPPIARPRATSLDASTASRNRCTSAPKWLPGGKTQVVGGNLGRAARVLAEPSAEAGQECGACRRDRRQRIQTGQHPDEKIVTGRGQALTPADQGNGVEQCPIDVAVTARLLDTRACGVAFAMDHACAVLDSNREALGGDVSDWRRPVRDRR